MDHHLTKWILVAAATTVTGCADEEAIEFTDLTGGPFAVEQGRPLAVGATMELRVTSTEEGNNLESATTTNRDVFDVSDGGRSTLLITGVGAGAARLQVRFANGTRSQWTIEVAEVADSVVYPLPWEPLLFGVPPADMFENGVALLPESALLIFTQHFDGQGRPLTGTGANPWQLEQGAEGTLTPEAGGDYGTIRSQSQTQVLRLHNGAVAYEIEVVDSSAISEVYLLESAKSPQCPDPAPLFFCYQRRVSPEQSLVMELNRTRYLYLAANLEDGRQVLGQNPELLHCPGQGPCIVLGQSDVSVLETRDLSPSSYYEDDRRWESDDWLINFLWPDRSVEVTAVGLGEADLAIEWADRVATLHVSVEAP